MSRKVLLTGKNQSIIDDFFYSIGNTLECQSTSLRLEDIMCHNRYFKPDILIYCLLDETKDSLTQISNIQKKMKDMGVDLAIIGDSRDCDEFEAFVGKADLVMKKPITAFEIENILVKYLADTEIMRAAVKLRKEQEEKEKREEAARKLQEEMRNNTQDAVADEPVVPEEEQLKHVMIIDDDPGMLKVIKEYLKGRYEVATAINGKLALKFLESKKTDLILLDYEMPGDDGVAVLNKLRENPETSKIPVVFLTGVKDGKKIKVVLDMKPQGYLLKPVDRVMLYDAISSIIG